MKYDTDDIQKQAVVDFSSRRRINNKTSQAGKSKDQLEMKAKIEEAKVHAQKELIAFREIMNKAKKDCSELVLFKDAANVIDKIFIQTILEGITEPVIKGKQIPNMDPTVFKEMRKDMYRDLIQEYCKDNS